MLPPLDKSEITHIVLCDGDIETLGYFSNGLAKNFRTQGYEVMIFHMQDEINSIHNLAHFCVPMKTAFVTFNYIGLIKEECFKMPDGRSVWDAANVYCINIVVDHPFYYHKFMPMLPKRYFQYCIDKDHLAYINRYFPEIKHSAFLPLAGTQLHKKLVPYLRRRTDVVFTGNYTAPKVFEEEITQKGKDYEEFYRGIIDDLIANPEQSMERVFEKHILHDIPYAKDSDLRDCMCNMIFIDLYVRFYFRGLVVKTLVDAGIKVTIYGAGWDRLECEHPENIISYGGVDSRKCLEEIGNAKLSLNVMPWFKQGAHDRIFNSMLNGAVCVSDSSNYLDDILTDQKDIAFYSLKHIDQLPDIVNNLLNDQEKAAEIARNGHATAEASHTWHDRSEIILQNIKNYSFRYSN